MLHSAVLDDLDILQVRVELARADIVRMGNRVPEHGLLFTNMTLHRHNHHSRQKTEMVSGDTARVNRQQLFQ
jgi:hypothetical protein